ncbi:MAG: 50S ribosomal protein L11 methyltransferase [Bacteroidetes bacterium]|nr:50S ribosomal protein L11 methyltransferase [Bacteroidota bacterium]
MKNYKQFNITFRPFLPDLVSGLLWELDILGINEEDNFLFVFCSEESEVSIEQIEKILASLQRENLIETFSMESLILAYRNWNEEWEKKVNVIQVSDRIVIKPTFRSYDAKENQIVITIDPKMSFGTGEHQTTKIMLQLLEKFTSNGDAVLDVGSGTGVLAIASVLLGAAKAVAVDNDEWCLDNGIENIKLNSVEDKVHAVLGELSDISESGFDLIAANINKHILPDIVHELRNKIRKSGKLLLSGLLVQDELDIKEAYSTAGFKHIETVKMDEWIGLVFTV